MRPTATPDVSNVKTLEDLKRFSSIYLNQVDQILKGNIQFGDNVRQQIVDVVFSTANFETSVRHNIGITPIGYIVVGSSVAMSVYDGGTSNTANFVYLKSSTTGTARVMLIT